MVQHAAAVVAGVGEVDAPPVTRRGPVDAVVVVGIPTIGVVPQGGEDDGVFHCAVGHQRPVYGQVTPGVLELDHRPRLERQGRATVDGQPALDDVDQVRVPGLVESDVTAHPHAVDLVIVGRVAREGRVAGGVHIDGVVAVAPDHIVGDGRGRGPFQADAPAGVVQNPVALDGGVGVVAGVDAIADVLVDDVVLQCRRGAVHVDRAAGAAAVAHLGVAQLGQCIHAGIAEGDAAPIARRRPGGRPVVVGIAPHAVVLDRGEDDVAIGGSFGIQDAVDRQVLPGLELDHHPRLDGQLYASVDCHVTDDDVGAIGQRPGGVGGDGPTYLGWGRRRGQVGQGSRWGDGRRGLPGGIVHVIAHSIARAAGVAGVAGAGVAPPPVVGGVEGVRGISVVETVLSVAVDVTVVDDQISHRAVVDTGGVLAEDAVLDEGTGVLDVEAPILASHDDQMTESRGAAVQEERPGGRVAPAIAHRHIVQGRGARRGSEADGLPVSSGGGAGD